MKFNAFKIDPLTASSHLANPNFGGVLSLEYSFATAFAANVFGGVYAGESISPYFGAEVGAFPIRVPISERTNGFEFVFLIGAGSASSVDGTPVSLHAGVRFNVNLNEAIGITAAGRISFSYALFEAGLVTRL